MTPTERAVDVVQVTQADREAAADIWRDYVARIGEVIAENVMRSGGMDDGLPTTLARHRLSSGDAAAVREACAKVAETLPMGMFNHPEAIAAAIRALPLPTGAAIGDDMVRKVLADLLQYVVTNECTHEDTHRGGSIWTICDACDRKWADDEGGFQPYSEPPEVAAARAMLAASQEPSQ